MNYRVPWMRTGFVMLWPEHRPLDLSCFAYLSVPRRAQTNPTLITNYPLVWTDHYLERHYQRLDPVITQAFNDTEPFK
jgi:LuxR family transcriptional activator of conjugal transfer of Ti plasmids